MGPAIGEQLYSMPESTEVLITTIIRCHSAYRHNEPHHLLRAQKLPVKFLENGLIEQVTMEQATKELRF